MDNKTHEEIVLIRKELQAVRKCLEFNFQKENRAKEIIEGVQQAVSLAIHDTYEEGKENG